VGRAGQVPQVFKIIHSPEDNILKIDPAASSIGIEARTDPMAKKTGD
jgi:hypothetical protein